MNHERLGALRLSWTTDPYQRDLDLDVVFENLEAKPKTVNILNTSSRVDDTTVAINWNLAFDLGFPRYI